MSVFDSPFGSITLLPLHHHPKSPLQAWNSADERLLQQVSQATKNNGNILIINDQYGALTTALHDGNPLSWGDSHSSLLSLQANLSRNQLGFDKQRWLSADSQPQGTFDLALIQIPKTLSLLEYQLATLRPCLHSESRIIAAGMVKHLSKSMLSAFETLIGPTTTSLAEKKSRLIFSTFNPQITAPLPQPIQYGIPNSPLMLINHANVFSQSKLDIGTRLLLEHFPGVDHAKRILDLGCGNGALGCYAAWKNPNAEILFTDDSYLALSSARASLAHNRLNNATRFIAADALDGVHESVDLILCNPPFHSGNRLDDQIAQRMFKDAKRCLNPGGKLVVVGNRHLNYHQSLKRYFKHTTLIASNSKFVIIEGSG